MTIALTGNGGLFTRLGLLYGGMADLLSIEGGTATTHVASGASMQARYTTLQVADAYAPVLNFLLDGFYAQLGGWQSQQQGFLQQFATLATNTVINQANADTPLSTLTLPAALAVLLYQMTLNSDTIQASTISLGGQTAVGTPNGNAVWALGTLNYYGQQLDTLFPETLTLTCTADSVTGGATLNQERLSIVGQAAAPSVYSYKYPQGSGSSLSLQAIDANTYGPTTQLLSNGGFTTFSTANVPDNWVVQTGTAGTQIIQSGTSYYGSYSLEFAGDGSTNTAVYQPFLTANSTTLNGGGTPASLKPSTQYAVNAWVKCNATTTTGVLQINLTNSSNTIINNSSGTGNTLSIAMTGVTTSWAPFTAFMQTPSILPSGYRLQLLLSTALPSGKDIFIDRIAFTPTPQIYPGGPPTAVFSGSSKLIQGDAWTNAVSNTYGKFALYLDRTFNLRQLGLFFNSVASSPTIADSLIV